jgi:cholesterol transport system auxiliary component
MRRSFFVILLALSSPLASGCALLSKSDPVVPRYFSPELADASPAAKPEGARQLSVRLGRVGGGSYLKERIVYRGSDHEFGFYEDRRWTERPEVYLQRALEGSLFEERSVRRSLAATAPTLTADLVEFEEVRGAVPKVRLRVAYALHDEQTVFFERTFSVEHPLPPGPDDSRTSRVAASLGEALREAVGRISSEVVTELAAAPHIKEPPLAAPSVADVR